jgi:hypothetical protein
MMPLMRLWTSLDATIVDIPGERGGVRLRLPAAGPPRAEAIDGAITLAPHDPFGALSAAGRDADLSAIPGLCAAVELADDQVAALIEQRKGALVLARGAWPERGREWSESGPIGAQRPLKVAWPRGVLWSDIPPRSRARRPVARPGVLTLTATTYGLCVACSHTGLVYVIRAGVVPELVLQVPVNEGARIDALATREGALVTLTLSSGVGALVHFDERGLDLGWRGGSGLTPPQLLARDRVLTFDHGDDDHLTLLALPDLSPVGERIPLGFCARDAAVTADGLAFTIASEDHLVEGRLEARGLVLSRRHDLRALLAAPAANDDDLKLAVDMKDLADALFDDPSAAAPPAITPPPSTAESPPRAPDPTEPEPVPAPLDDIEALEVESIEIVQEKAEAVPVARLHGKSASNRPPPPPPPRRRDDPPALALGVLSQEPIGRWQAAVGREFELVLSIRSAGGAGRGLHLVVSGEAITRGLVALTALSADDTLAPIGRAQAGVVCVDLPDLELPAGFTYPFDPAPSTPEARGVAESALATTHRELRLRGRGVRPGSGLLALSLSVPGSAGAPLRWIRPLAVTPA